MSLIHSLTALAALTSLASASPVLDKRRTFSVEQKYNAPKPQVPILMARTYAKYNAVMPVDVANAAAAAVTGSVAANPEEYDAEYLCPVNVGGTTMMLDFDTGSADLWVFSNLLSASQRSGHAYYTPSSSATRTSSTWRISYGDGSGAAGVVYDDTVTVGGVTATSQAVEAATSISSAFQQDQDNDGLLGLAFSSINTVTPTRATTFFDTVKSQLAAPLFAVTLKKGAPGTYDFGYIDSSKYTGTLNYVNVITTNGFWEFTATGYAVGSGATTSTSIDAIADTGTTLLYLPTAVVSAYYAQVSGASYSSSAGGYTFSCTATLPSFTAIIGGKRATVPGSFINYAPAGSGRCFGGIQRNTGIGFSIFGDIFLKSQYVVHDMSGSTPRLGFAQQAGIPSS